MSRCTQITFNKDLMTVKDLKNCAETLDGILQSFDQFKNDPEEFLLRVMQCRDFYKTSREDK
jgi:hypothetical protein